MLKLTRQLYSWQPDGALFDYYERAHLNHVMAAQDPATGGFTYMTPLMTGAERGYSNPKEDAFWCCVGTGMESHAKHGESVFWEGEGTLLVNLYIPATANWAARKATLTLETRYPAEPESRLTLTKLKRSTTFSVALRVPAWANGKAIVKVNGALITPQFARGYAVVRRRWQEGDTVGIHLPLDLRLEAAPGDAGTVAILRGPMVLAADLGSTTQKWDSPDPALVGEDLLSGFQPATLETVSFRTNGIVRPADLTFVPFYRQHDRRSAVYFKRFTEAAWKDEQTVFLAEQARQRDIAARSVDIMHLGEMQPEHDHGLASELSYPVNYRGKQGRDARSGGYFVFTMKTRPGPLVLQATYWGDERGHSFDILVDDVVLASQELKANQPGKFFDVDYPLPAALTSGKTSIKVRFVPHSHSTAGPVFGVVLFTAKQESEA